MCSQMSQLLGLLTQMRCDKYLQHRYVDDGTLIADADLQNILDLLTDGGYSCSNPVFRIIFSLLKT